MEISYKELKLHVPEEVYPPAEDSFLLAGAACKAGEVLEIGCGCGIVSLSWAKDNTVLGVDINPSAVEASIENASRNSISATFRESNLFSNVSGKFDAILFNPPYLPTSKQEKLEGHINKAYDGGKDGRETLEKFLSEFSGYLKDDGTLYLIQSSLNNIESTMARLRHLGFKVEEIGKHEFFFEKLILLKASR
jgi:release factor glutamine methyltransferase